MADIPSFDTQTLGQLRERYDMLERFHTRMCTRKSARQWEALAVNYSLRIGQLEEAAREAADFFLTDNSEHKKRIQAKLRRLAPLSPSDDI